MCCFLLVLGCRVTGSHAEPTLKMRIDAAADYMLKHENVTAVACGGVVHPDQLVSEAAVIRDGLISRGISSDRVLLEDKSLTTVENFVNAKQIIADAYIRGHFVNADMQLSGAANEANLSFEALQNVKLRVLFLSSDFHLRRAALIAKKCGYSLITAVSAPSPRDKLVINRLRELLVFPASLLMRRL